MGASVYEDNFLQNLFNPMKWNLLDKFDSKKLDTLIKSTYSGDKEFKYKIDFPHFMVGYATAFEVPFYEGKLWDASWRNFVRTIVSISRIHVNTFPEPSIIHSSPQINRLHLNSLTGGLLSEMDDKDLMTDIDLLILLRHPKYRALSLDKKLFLYYNQSSQMENRVRLLYESYSLTSLDVARKEVWDEINVAAKTVGGLAFLAMFFNRNHKKNYERLTELLDSEDERQKKQKAKEKSIVHKVVDKVKEVFVPIKKIVTKPTIVDTVKKVVKDVTKKIINGVKKSIPSKPSTPKQPKKSKKKGR